MWFHERVSPLLASVLALLVSYRPLAHAVRSFHCICRHHRLAWSDTHPSLSLVACNFVVSTLRTWLLCLSEFLTTARLQRLGIATQASNGVPDGGIRSSSSYDIVQETSIEPGTHTARDAARAAREDADEAWLR